MSDLRTAAQMALDALLLEATEPPIPETAAAIDALRAALAAEPQPVGRVFVEDGAVHINPLHRDASHPDALKDGQKLYTAVPTAQPVPEVIPQDWAGIEPAVAFHLIERHAENWTHAGALMEAWKAANSTTVQPLTDEQIHKEFHERINADAEDMALDVLDFKVGVRFAEKHHGIGGTHG